MKTSKNILFLLNPISGIGKKGDLADLIQKYLTNHKHELRYTEYRKHGEEIANLEKGNFDAIVAIGGDGTVNEALQGIMKNGKAPDQLELILIPAGSSCDFAKKYPNNKSNIDLVLSEDLFAVDIG